MSSQIKDAINYLKNIPDGHGFIQGLPGSGKSTVIKWSIKARLDIDDLQKKERKQILVCCPSNDAVNSVCGSTHVAFPTKGINRGYPYAIELSHVEYLAQLYNGGVLKQTSESVSYDPQLSGHKDNTKMLRNRSLLYIGAGHRTLQRVGLLDVHGDFLNADQDSTLHDLENLSKI